MILVTKNKRASLLFRRSIEQQPPPEVSVFGSIVLKTESIAMVKDEIDTKVDDSLVVTLDTGFNTVCDGEMVLSVVCGKEA